MVCHRHVAQIGDDESESESLVEKVRRREKEYRDMKARMRAAAGGEGDFKDW